VQTLYAGLRLTIDRKGSRPEPARAPAIAEVTLASHGTDASCSRRGLAAVTAAGIMETSGRGTDVQRPRGDGEILC
jgi:hypothetical protein